MNKESGRSRDGIWGAAGDGEGWLKYFELIWRGLMKLSR